MARSTGIDRSDCYTYLGFRILNFLKPTSLRRQRHSGWHVKCLHLEGALPQQVARLEAAVEQRRPKHRLHLGMRAEDARHLEWPVRVCDFGGGVVKGPLCGNSTVQKKKSPN